MNNIFISSDNLMDINMDEVTIVTEEYYDRIVLHGRITGIINSNINITYENQYLTITYTRTLKQSLGDSWSNISVSQSKTENKSFYLPTIDPTKLTATFENDMLNIIIMKIQIDDNINEDIEIINVEDFYQS